jgi:hypothetical protein
MSRISPSTCEKISTALSTWARSRNVTALMIDAPDFDAPIKARSGRYSLHSDCRIEM